MVIKTIVFLVIFYATSSSCENILFVNTVYSPSHHIFFKTLALGLVEKGHNVTMLTHEAERTTPANFTVITMEGMQSKIASTFDINGISNLGPMDMVKIFSDYNLLAIEFDHTTDGFKTLWNYPEDFKFDVIICEASIGRFGYIFNERFHNPPAIAVSPFLLPPYLSTAFGGYPLTVYEPYHSTYFTDSMSIVERAYNIFYTYIDVLYHSYIHSAKENALIRAHYPWMKETLNEIESRISLVLCNMDPILDYPRILPPNIIPIGGLHSRPPKALPKDYQELMDRSNAGVILFSLGTNVRSDKIEAKSIKSLLKVFSKLSETVLWKFESDIEGVPKNVILRKWLPQNDILGHPNAKLFIHHGGALSTQESLYHGVPMIVIPFFSDQLVNSVKVRTKKIGIVLQQHELNEETIEKALDKVLNTSAYVENVRILSKKYRDQPLSALDRAIFWVEYLIRHGNADHLSAPTRWLPFSKVFHLDILGIIIICFIFVLSLIVKLCKVCMKYFFRKKPKLTKIN